MAVECGQTSFSLSLSVCLSVQFALVGGWSTVEVGLFQPVCCSPGGVDTNRQTNACTAKEGKGQEKKALLVVDVSVSGYLSGFFGGLADGQIRVTPCKMRYLEHTYSVPGTP